MPKIINSEYKCLDWMSILIEKELDKYDFVDYVFICNVHFKDPRFKERNILIGQNRGLFRINKENLESKLLLAMEGDEANLRFTRASKKVISEYKFAHAFPEKTHFACS